MRIPSATLAAGLALAAASLPVQALDTRASAAMVIDHNTGTVLMAKNADDAIPPASMSKLMTLYMVFEALQSGRLALDDTFRVSEKAWKMGGSKMFLNVGDEVSIENLIRGIIVQSGNDACIVVAEGLAGSENEFAIRMTQRGRELGLEESVFANSTGWPHPDHRMSARDLVRIATLLIENFPEYYPYFNERSFTWEGIEQENRNPLLALEIGGDGLKTGHTEEAGYGLVGSAEQNDRRVTLMVTGLETTRARLLESERLISWGFREFAERELYAPDTTVAEAEVWLGATPTVPLVAEGGVMALIPWAERDELEVWVEYDGPLEAPIEAGAPLAELVIATPELGETRYPLVAGAAVAPGGFLARMQASALILADRALEAALGGDETAATDAAAPATADGES